MKTMRIKLRNLFQNISHGMLFNCPQNNIKKEKKEYLNCNWLNVAYFSQTSNGGPYRSCCCRGVRVSTSGNGSFTFFAVPDTDY